MNFPFVYDHKRVLFIVSIPWIIWSLSLLVRIGDFDRNSTPLKVTFFCVLTLKILTRSNDYPVWYLYKEGFSSRYYLTTIRHSCCGYWSLLCFIQSKSHLLLSITTPTSFLTFFYYFTIRPCYTDSAKEVRTTGNPFRITLSRLTLTVLKISRKFHYYLSGKLWTLLVMMPPFNLRTCMSLLYMNRDFMFMVHRIWHYIYFPNLLIGETWRPTVFL